MPLKSNSLPTCLVVSSKRVVLHTLHVDRSDAVEVTRRRDQDADLRRDGVIGHSLHACRAQKGSHSAINVRIPEPRRADLHTNVRFSTIITSVAFCNQIWESTNKVGVTRSRFLRTSACLSSHLNCSRVGNEMMVTQSTRNSSDLSLLETTSCRLYQQWIERGSRGQHNERHLTTVTHHVGSQWKRTCP